MTRFVSGVAITAIAISSATALPAQAQSTRSQVTPYIEAGQVLSADLNGGDVITYSRVAVGIDASVQTRRVEVQANYNYERRFAWDDSLAADDIHSGIARAAVRLAPGVSIEGGALATRARVDQRADIPLSQVGDARNVSQLYSAYAGPTIATNVGALQTNAAYRFGYTKVEAPSIPSIDPARPPIDLYDSATRHAALASVGARAGTILPVGVTLSGAWNREDAGQLDQRFDGKYGRGDVVLPVGQGVALTAGVGYERIEVSQRDPLRDANGRPLTDGAGRQLTDPASPRRIAYDLDGIFWDAGVIYRPSRRMNLEARVGRRYGSMSYTGALQWQTGRNSALQAGVYDSVTTFGQQLNSQLALLPTQFSTGTDPFGGDFNGCVFGTVGASAGGCLATVSGPATASAYRVRGIDAVLSATSGRTRLGLGAGYAHRRYIAPDDGVAFSVDGMTEQSVYAQFFAVRDLSAVSSLSGNVFASYYDSSLPRTNSVFAGGGNATYTHSFGRLGAMASAGLYGMDVADNTQISIQAMLGLRYSF